MLLTKLFLRQFLENDLLSPDGDRSQLLAIVGASVISLTLFISMFTSAGYAMSIMMPGEAAVLTLSDKFFYTVAGDAGDGAGRGRAVGRAGDRLP